MAPFIPLHQNKEYFISSKDLGYEYSHLLDTSKFLPRSKWIIFHFCITLTLIFSDQRLSESLRPYLEELRETWPWMLCAALCGVIVTMAVAVAVQIVKQRYRGSSWPQGRSWRGGFVLPERQPLILSDEKSNINHPNYQTAMWRLHSNAKDFSFQLCELLRIDLRYKVCNYWLFKTLWRNLRWKILH